MLASCLVSLVSTNGWNLAQALHHCERILLEAALRRKGGNQSETGRQHQDGQNHHESESQKGSSHLASLGTSRSGSENPQSL